MAGRGLVQGDQHRRPRRIPHGLGRFDAEQHQPMPALPDVEGRALARLGRQLLEHWQHVLVQPEIAAIGGAELHQLGAQLIAAVAQPDDIARAFERDQKPQDRRLCERRRLGELGQPPRAVADEGVEHGERPLGGGDALRPARRSFLHRRRRHLQA
jgi:hypothetical protein